MKAKLYPAPKAEDFLWRVEVETLLIIVPKYFFCLYALVFPTSIGFIGGLVCHHDHDHDDNDDDHHHHH